MPIPFLLGALAVGAGAVGVAGAVDGISKTSKANERVNSAKSRHEKNQKKVKDKVAETSLYMDELAKKELETIKSFKRFSEVFEKIKNKPIFETYTRNGINIPKYNAEKIEEVSIGAEALLGGLAGAAVGTAAGYAAAGVTTSAIFAFGSAGTGAAISGLKGAALTNATLAWLGGGTIAAGGGGMALGTTILTGMTLGVGLLVGGVIFSMAGNSISEKADRAYEEMLVAEQEMDKVYNYMSALKNIAVEFKETFIKVENSYKINLQSLIYIVERMKKTDWNDFTIQEKLITENTVLLIGLLYKLGQVKLVLQKDGEELNTINTYSVKKEIYEANKFLYDNGMETVASYNPNEDFALSKETLEKEEIYKEIKRFSNGDCEKYNLSFGEKSGKAVYYWKNGDCEERYYIRGKLNGEAIYYWVNGAYEKRKYVNGVLHGKAIYYYPNGNYLVKMYVCGNLQNS